MQLKRDREMKAVHRKSLKTVNPKISL